MGLLTGPQIRTKSLAIVCRSLATMLEAGIAIAKAFELASRKTNDARCARALREIAADIKKGSDISGSMAEQGGRFPDTMVDLVRVGEQTGSMPEVLRSLAGHFEQNIRLRRSLIASITWPAIQLVMAILIIAGMLYILGLVAHSQPGGKPLDVLGLGLYGAEGAATWLMLTFGTIGGAIFAIALLRKSIVGRKFLDPLWMKIPVLANCLRSLAIARFSWSFALTQQAGMPIDQSLQSSFRATSNGAFLLAAPGVWAMVREGETLHDALRASRLFPEEYLHIVDVAETSGTVPEALDRLSPDFQEQAQRSLHVLATALSWSIRGLVGAFIIFLILRLAMFYIGMINEAANAANRV